MTLHILVSVWTRRSHWLRLAALGWLGLMSGPAAAQMVISGISDQSRYASSATFTITGATQATLDGAPVRLGETVTVSSIGYHELAATAAGESQRVRFIVKNPARGSSEDGLPSFTPRPWVPDAPAALARGELRLLAPRTYPSGLPLPVVAQLVKGATFGAAAGEPLWLNGHVVSHDHEGAELKLRRGWGSTILSRTKTGNSEIVWTVPETAITTRWPVHVEEVTSWTARGGTLSTTETWAAGARIDLTERLIIAEGGTLTIGPGTVVRCAAGVEIWVRAGGSIECHGTPEAPVIFTPVDTASPWGGFWLQPETNNKTARLVASNTVFCCWGAARNWFNAPLPAGEPERQFSRHRSEGPLAALGPGSLCELTDCALVGPVAVEANRGTAFASTNATLSLTRTLVQRATTGGQQNGGTVTVRESAVLEMTEPGAAIDSDTFFDEDNDGLYLVPGAGRTYRIEKTVIGWCRDDGIDTGASGAGSTLVDHCWFENCTHEAISCSGAGRRPEARGTVFFNNGQGMECGYGSGGTGPLALLENCALVSNLVGARYGDNYGGGSWTYGGTMTVRNCLLLHNEYHDTWALEFTSWQPQNERLHLTGSRLTSAADLSAQDGEEDGENGSWNPATEASQLVPFLPAGESPVGVTLLAPTPQASFASYPRELTAHLSTFSSRPVRVAWQIASHAEIPSEPAAILASGQLEFAPGETVKSWPAPTLGAGAWQLLSVSLHHPEGATVSGSPVIYFQVPEPPAPRAFVPWSAEGWSYQAARREPPIDEQGHPWYDMDYVMINWRENCVAPLGCGSLGDDPPVALGTRFSAAEQGSSGDRTLTIYFRKEFTVDDPSELSGLEVEFLLDDGAVFYLNGVEVLRQNIDESTTASDGTLRYTTLALQGISGADEALATRRLLPSAALALLRPRRNVLAVEVHQEDADSGDLLLDVCLLGKHALAAEATRLGVLSLHEQKYLFWYAPDLNLEYSEDLTHWRPIHTPGPFPLPQPPASARFFRLMPP